ncbi:MAG TPA: efflux RND transporter permease subunit [Spirochaetota bacterium]|nr:efflux RND transporter permease subunit [Spirochaetota bacterium]
MEKYIELVLNRPKTVLAILLFVTIALGSGMPKLRFDTSVDVMMPQHDEQYLYNEEVKKVYGNNGKLIVMNLSAPNLWSRNFFQDVDRLTDDIEEYRTFDEEKENGRLEKFRGLSREPGASRETLLAGFQDDPVYRRTLEREMDRLPLQGRVFNTVAVSALEKRLIHLHSLKKQKLVDGVITPVTMKDVSGRDDTLRVVHLVDKDDTGRRILPASAKDFEVYKKKLTKNPAFEGALYARDPASGEITAFSLVVRLENIKKDDELAREMWNIAKSYRGMEVLPQGIPIVNIFMSDYMKRDLLSFLPLVLLVVLVVFFLNFRTIRGMVLPMATLILTDVWVMGLMGHLGKNITVVGTSLPTLMVSVGSSYSIHMLNQYYIDLNSMGNVEIRKGLKMSMAHIAITVMLAGLTTFIGFLSLVTNQVIGIREWGIFSAIGVLFAVVISTSMIPATLVLLPKKKSAPLFGKGRKEGGGDGRTWLTPLIGMVTEWSIGHYRRVLAVMGVVIALSLYGAWMMKVDTNFLSYFKEGDYVRSSVKVIGNNFGGTSGFSILIDSGEQDGVKDPAFLNALEDLRRWLKAPENLDLSISRTDAFPDVIKSMHMAMNNDDPAYWKVPEKKADIVDYMEIYSGDDDDFDGRFDDFESYVDPQYRTAQIFAKIHHHTGELLATSDVKRIQAKIDDHLKESLPRPYSYRITGEPSVMVRMSEYQISGQMSSLALSLVVVGLIVVMLFKSWKAGLVSLIPMSTAVLMNFGIMGWLGISLDAATSIIAAVTIGIGVDDTIHFLNTFRHFRKKGLGIDETIRKTLGVAGTAIIYTSLALVFGFSVLVVSNFKPLIYTGLLIANTMVATTLGALILLPTAIKATGVTLDESASESFFWRIFHIGRFFDFEEE